MSSFVLKVNEQSELYQVKIAIHYGSKQDDIETSNYTFSHELGSERNERASE